MCPHPTLPSAPPAPPPPINTEHYAATTPPTCYQHWLREKNTATTNRPTNPAHLDKYPLSTHTGRLDAPRGLAVLHAQVAGYAPEKVVLAHESDELFGYVPA